MKKLWWLIILVLVPAVVYAQPPPVQYTTLTPIDSAYLYMGLGMQWTIRGSVSMQNIPPAIVICCLLYLLLKRATSANPEPLVAIVMYFITATMISVLFWPESVAPFVSNLNNPVYPNAITALSANTGGFPTKDTAEEVIDHLEGRNASPYLVPGTKWGFDGNLLTPTSAQVPPTFDLILRAAIDIPLQLAMTLNKNASKPFKNSFSFQGLHGLELPGRLINFIALEYMDCYYQTIWNMIVDDVVPQNNPDDIDWKLYLPWQEPVKSRMEVDTLWTDAVEPMYRKTAETNFSSRFHRNKMTCKLVVEFVNTGIDYYLDKDYDGAPGTNHKFYQVVYEGTRLKKEEQRHYLIYRFMENYAPVAIKSQTLKHLAVAGAVVGGAAAVTNAAAAFSAGGVGTAEKADGIVVRGKNTGGSWWGSTLGVAGALFGAVRPILSDIMDFIRPALVVLYFMPHITGMISAVTIGLFPIVIAWCLFPGQHFKPLINYFMVLLFSQSAPMWYSIGDALSGFAYRSLGGAPSPDAIDKLINGVQGHAAGIFVGVLSVFVVPMIQAIIMFGAWRAIGGAIKGG